MSFERQHPRSTDMVRRQMRAVNECDAFGRPSLHEPSVCMHLGVLVGTILHACSVGRRMSRFRDRAYATGCDVLQPACIVAWILTQVRAAACTYYPHSSDSSPLHALQRVYPYLSV